MQEDTIAAIATAPGEAAIAIIRMSGIDAVRKADEVFRARRPGTRLEKVASHTLTLGQVVDQGRVVDEVLAAVMRGPRSYTGEDVVEFHCHGGFLPARRVLGVLLARGVRLAEPGEFTRRAFLNGKLELSRAEAVIEVIRARSERGMDIALARLGGQGLEFLERVEEDIIGLLAMVEASIDFPDEVGEIDTVQAGRSADEIMSLMKEMICLGEKGRIYREGIKAVICGKPNVGKSSLLNSLLREDRVIVTEVPGTTRDLIEEYINIKGVPVRIVDTAGIRAAADVVEKLGIERSRKALADADLAILVVEAGGWLDSEDREVIKIIREAGVKALVLVNKVDIGDPGQGGELEELSQVGPVIYGSMLTGEGLEELESTIFEMAVGGDIRTEEWGLVANTRQVAVLKQACEHMEAFKQGIKDGVTLDCLAVDLLAAREKVGSITGNTASEEVIDRIFREFCIGK